VTKQYSARTVTLDGAWVDVAALHLSSFTRVTFFTH